MNILNYSSFLEGKKEKFPNYKKVEIDGYVIYVGKDSKSNDYITFKIAEDDEYWLHVKGIPGSHVIIKNNNDQKPDITTIKQAAQLAKNNSKASKESGVNIVYCLRKFVTKDINMKDGQVKVDYINASEIII
jgi:predicted ribosome quality control (RQC) complex YloA/Tae2 family protein